MTLPVPNMSAPLVDKNGNILRPWNSFFQQFVQPAPAVVDVTLLSPFTANSNGTLILTNVFTDLTHFIILTRGLISIPISGVNAVIPIAIGDTVSWTNNAIPPPNNTIVQFLGN